MSRTDKDTPWWVFATEWEPWHCHEYREPIPPEDRERYWRGELKRKRVTLECTLPPEPRLQDYQARDLRRQCLWKPVWFSSPATFYSRLPPGCPPRWYILHVGHNSSRRVARDTCIAARKEYRATGEVEAVVPIDQFRHNAHWLWW